MMGPIWYVASQGGWASFPTLGEACFYASAICHVARRPLITTSEVRAINRSRALDQ